VNAIWELREREKISRQISKAVIGREVTAHRYEDERELSSFHAARACLLGNVSDYPRIHAKSLSANWYDSCKPEALAGYDSTPALDQQNDAHHHAQ